MLLLNQVGFNLNTFHFASRLCLIPIRLDYGTGTILKETSKTRILIGKMVVAQFCLKICFVVFNFIRQFYSPSSLDLKYFPIILGEAGGFALYLFWMYLTFFRNLDITIAVFNLMFEVNVKRSLISRKKYTCEDVMVQFLP
ncbi:unnamed protein product, partial [Allacma fusca]